MCGEGGRLDAGLGGIRPLELHSVLTEDFGLPGADVGNFSVCVVVPALPGDWIVTASQSSCEEVEVSASKVVKPPWQPVQPG